MNKPIPTLYLGLIALFISCHEQNVSHVNAVSDKILKEIPSSWTMLTEYNGQLVIFHPCDANNALVEIHDDTLHINWGLEEGFYRIKSITKPSNGKIAMTGETDIGENEERFSVTFLDAEKKLSRWHVWLDDTTSAIFTDSRFKDDFKEVKQPCSECWGYDVCNEAEGKDSSRAKTAAPELIASDF
jgi:hypothetical protein